MRRLFAVENIFVFSGPTPSYYNNSRKVSVVSTVSVSRQVMASLLVSTVMDSHQKNKGFYRL